MVKKPINPIINHTYKELEKQEDKLRKQMRTLFTANTGRIASIVASIYHDCTENNEIRYSYLFRTITKKQAADLQRQAAKTRRAFGDYVENDFPFSVLRFDRLNRLDATKAQLILNELDTVTEMYPLIMLHLEAQAMATMAMLIRDLDIDREIKQKQVEAVARNNTRPILLSLYNQHRAMGEREATILQQSMTRGNAVTKTADLVEEYSAKRAQTSSDRLIYTEDTRATMEAVDEVVHDIASYFKTVCVHDGKACEVCLGIEKEQAIRPVPMTDFISGITAPPFHPYCRCGIEVIWNDENNENRQSNNDEGSR